MAAMPSAVPSPSRVSNQIELATSRLVRRARSASTSLQLHQVSRRVPVVRQAISNVVSVDSIVSAAELLLLMAKLIPREYPVFSSHCLSNFSYIFLSFLPKHFSTLSTASLCSFPISSRSFLSMTSGHHFSPGDGSLSLFPSHSRTPSIFPRRHQQAVVVTQSSTADLSIPSPLPSQRRSSYSPSSTAHVRSSPQTP